MSNTALDYVCPEVLKNTINGRECFYGPELDWWSFGVILFECLNDDVPFYDESHLKTKALIQDHENYIETEGFFKDSSELGYSMSDEYKDLVKKLLSKRTVRLGRNSGPKNLPNSSIEDLTSHPWFKNVDWTFDNIRSHPPPFATLTNIKSSEDTSNFEEIEAEDLENVPTLRNLNVNNKEYQGKNLQFVGFSYNTLGEGLEGQGIGMGLNHSLHWCTFSHLSHFLKISCIFRIFLIA